MADVTINWLFEIDAEYAYGFLEDTPVAASRNKYSKLLDEGNPEFQDFVSFIIEYCEEYGLHLESKKDRLENNSLSRYLHFYNFNNTPGNNVNLIVEIRISDHFHHAEGRVQEVIRNAKKKYPAMKNEWIKVGRANLIFNGKYCHSYDDALDYLQLRLEQLDDKYHFYNSSEEDQ
jgi:hypothetical protein